MHSLNQWLSKLESLKISAKSLELERVHYIAKKLGLSQPSCPVVTVAGTNGKGSVVTLLEEILFQQGIKVAAYTTPYIKKFNEQIRINKHEILDVDLCRNFETIHLANDKNNLSLYEYKTLAALMHFQKNKPDIILLEVGIGGRKDAVNIFDPTIAVITSIGLDHCDWLGDTREKIAAEKAGIFRKNNIAIIGDCAPPATLVDKTMQQFFLQQDFSYHEEKNNWCWQSAKKQLANLPKPQCLLQNAATALMTLEQIQNFFLVEEVSIRRGLRDVVVPGRLQTIAMQPQIIIDVAHNADGVIELAQHLAKAPCKTVAIFSMLNSKEIGEALKIIDKQIEHWILLELSDPRAMTKVQLRQYFEKHNIFNFSLVDNPKIALLKANSLISREDRLVVFGSFRLIDGCLRFC